MRISYSFGMIDLMHYGHIIALKRAAKNADLKIFGMVSDAASHAWAGNMVSNEQEREEVLKGVKYVDMVMRQETFDPTDNLKKIHIKYPDAEITLFHGSDWKVIPAQKYVESIGGRAVTLDYYERLSPIRIIESLTKEENHPNKRFANLISTKANTLQLLKEKLLKSKIEDLYVFTVGEYWNDAETIIKEIQSRFLEKKIVIRSSSEREDAFESSNAGHFDSVLGVETKDVNAISSAIEQVIVSYGNKEGEGSNEQILIQSQTQGVLISGVVFTRDIQRNRPYYVINFDDSGSTDSVTSGIEGMSVWMIHSIEADNVPKKWRKLIDAIREIEKVLMGMLLDIEFAITATDIVIFQVRPLAAAYKFGRKGGSDDIENAREQAISKYEKYNKCGLTCYSDMAFWNPAEIIGDNPKNLDYSLYRHIITRHAWNEGIVTLGYRDVEKELMYRFGNKPYINIEYSFEALMPAALSAALVNKLKKYYMRQLKKDLSAHDKIEFEISLNCFDFSIRNHLQRLKEDFTQDELKELEDALYDLTKKIIDDYTDILKKDIDDIRILESIRLDILNITKNCNDICIIAQSIQTLLDAISKFGTPQFSRQARCAFIAKSLCKSLLDENYISADSYDEFMLSIKTVATDYERDYRTFLEGRMSREEFCSIYGHLRAGTYNIRSLRYDQLQQLLALECDTDIRSKENQRLKIEEENINIVLIKAIERALRESNVYNISAENILFFIRKATEEREYFKFVFTKSLSFAIELIKNIGQKVGIDTRDLSYLELPEVFAVEYYPEIERLKEFWSLIIEKRCELYKINSELILPSVICSTQDFDYIENLKSRPNYITEKKISADIEILSDESSYEKIEGKIIAIEQADPGYDWIFSKKIAGLITKYGGAASHMAIRCAEFGIPAAIGCGANLFDYIINSKRVLLDCKHENLCRLNGKQ